MAFRKGKSVNGFSIQKTGSVLSRVHDFITDWEESELVGELKALRGEYMNNNLLSFISSAVELPENNIAKMALISSVRKVKTNYNLTLKAAYEVYSAKRADLEYISFTNDAMKEKKDAEVKRELDDAVFYAVEKAQAELMALTDTFESAQIGLVAYEMTYKVTASNRGADIDNPARGLSFAWSAAKWHVLAALRVASNTTDKVSVKPVVKEFDALEVNKVNVGAFTLGLDGQTIANMIENWGNSVAVMVMQDENGNVRHDVFVKKQRVASIYPEYVTKFTGAHCFTAKVKDLKVNTKSLSFNLVSVTRY
jgi:hypothetical protein